MPLAKGSYDVTLKFAEIFFTQPGQRVFDVALEGAVPAALDGLDVVARAGGANTAFDVTQRVTVGDGELDLDFTGVVENPKVAAILVKPAS